MEKCTRRPLFCKYYGQCQAQNAYLYIDQNGEVSCEYTDSIGNNGCSAADFNGSVRRYRIDNQLTQSEIDALEEQIKPLAKELHEKWPVKWSGSNHTRGHSEELSEFEHDIERICELAVSEDFDACDDEECEYCNTEY